ncbi:MAG: protein kinase [Desulfosalsimonadaceae bacterium]
MPEANNIDKLKAVLGDKYEIVSLIAAGGMGEIYLGIHRVLGKKRAIKIIHQSVEKEKDIRQRFLQEAKLAASIDHPGIIQIMDFGSHDEFDYLIMPFIEGATLQEEMEKGAFDPEAALGRMLAMTDALAHAHRQNIIHRDIKPSNFMIDAEGRVILTDFGISKNLGDPNLTATNMILGSPKFMSPEQISGKPVDRRSDLYSLGLIFYQMVTGVYPFEAGDMASLAYKQVHEAPLPPSTANPRVPETLSTIITRLLEKDPDARYPGGDALLKDLQHLKEHGFTSPQSLSGGEGQSFEEMATRVTVKDSLGGPGERAGEQAGKKQGVPPFVSAKSVSRGRRKPLWILLAVGVSMAALVIVFFAADPVWQKVAPLLREKESQPALRDRDAREKAFLKRFAAHNGPFTQSDIRNICVLAVCVQEEGGEGASLAPDLRKLLAAMPFVRSGENNGCDVLIDIQAPSSAGKLSVESNLYECGDACSEELVIREGKIPSDRIRSLLARNYCFHLFTALNLIHTNRGGPSMDLEIPGKSENAFAVGEQVQFCMKPPFKAHSMLLNINADGIFKLFPLDRGQRAELIKDETGCTRVVQVSPPVGNELVVALGSVSNGVIDTYSQKFDSRMPVFSWPYEASGQNSAVDISEALFGQLVNQPAGSWTANSRFIRVVDHD